MKTIRDILSSGTAYLEARGIEGARSSMQALIAHVMNTDRTWIYLHTDETLPEDKLAELRTLLRSRGQGVPLQHLLGSVEFYRRSFRSDSRALIPRPETEELVELALRCFAPVAPPSPRILDMGCGSGVIGITLALELRDLKPDVALADISPAALSLALENATTLGARVRTFRSDLFSAWEPPTNEDTRILPPSSFHMIVAKLPYIPDHERLQVEVTHDPATALYGGDDGLDMIRRFVSQAKSHMEPGACLLLEVGHDQGERVVELMKQAGFARVSLHTDMSGAARFPVCHAPS